MIDQYPSSNGVLTSLIWRKTMSGGETSLSGYDNASQALSYTPGQEQVYLNGILLVRGDDYTATNGTSVTGLAALSASDFVQVNCYNNFSVASLPSTSITGEITNSQITSLATSKLTGTVANNQLANSSITINGSAVSLGGSTTVDLTTKTDKSTLTTTGDIYYASSANTPARLGIGSANQVLTVSSGIPSWATPASGGKVLQVVQATSTSTTSNSTSTFADATGLAVTITPTLNTSKVLVIFVHQIYISGADTSNCLNLRILRGATNIHNYGTELGRITVLNSKQLQATAIYLDSPASTSATTYKVQFNNNANTASVAINDPSSTMVAIAMEIGV